MTSNSASNDSSYVKAALQAVRNGFQPIPLGARSKAPTLTGWRQLRWDPDNLDEVRDRFTEWETSEGLTNLGVMLGEPSSGLIDVDIDHPHASRLRDYFLPSTAARSGRTSRPNTHYWYLATDVIPATRRYLMPKIEGTDDDKRVSVELRSTGSQTVIPPSEHDKTADTYRWEGRPWGGKDGPRPVPGRVLALQVALLGLGAVLIENWPRRGGRHDAYLALAGALLRRGDGVHPFWGPSDRNRQGNLPVLISALADATHDEDGDRVSEVMSSTVRRLNAGEQATGYGRLVEFIGEAHVKSVQTMVHEVESLAGYRPDGVERVERVEQLEREERESIEISAEDLEELDPLDARETTWEPVSLEKYLTHQVPLATPSVLERKDGHCLMYNGRVNMLYGSSESGKSWLSLMTCLQEMRKGERVLYIDFEDEPGETLERLALLGATADEIRMHFNYIRPEEPLASMERNRWGTAQASDTGIKNLEAFKKALDQIDPSLIVCDGMTVIYGLHGLDSNNSVSTEVITGWLKKLTRNRRTTVIIIDHTAKAAERGSLPIGSQHKVAMVQGTLLQVWPTKQPMPGAIGEVELIVLKDRPGQVRQHSAQGGGKKAQVAATVTIDSASVEGLTSIFISPPEQQFGGDVMEVDLQNVARAAQYEKDIALEERILYAFEGDLDREMRPQIIFSTVTDGKISERQVTNALLRLVKKGWLERDHAHERGRPVLYRLAVASDEYVPGDVRKDVAKNG